MAKPAPLAPRCSVLRVKIALALATLLWAVESALLAVAQDLPSRQVTLFGILATPSSTAVDPQLKTIAPQLRQLLPGHGFKLLEVQSKRLTIGESVSCSKLSGFVAETSLLNPLDTNGKVELHFALGEKVAQGSPGTQNVQMQAATIVVTPPNQLSFFEKQFPDGSRLLIGMAAR